MHSIRTRRRRRSRVALLGAAVVSSLAGYSASADPLVYLTLLARAQNSTDPYSNTVTVSAGETLEYQVIGGVAPVGTTNTFWTITSLNPGPDGLLNHRFDLYESINDDTQVSFPSAGTLNA